MQIRIRTDHEKKKMNKNRKQSKNKRIEMMNKDWFFEIQTWNFTSSITAAAWRCNAATGCELLRPPHSLRHHKSPTFSYSKASTFPPSVSLSTSPSTSTPPRPSAARRSIRGEPAASSSCFRVLGRTPASLQLRSRLRSWRPRAPRSRLPRTSTPFCD